MLHPREFVLTEMISSLARALPAQFCRRFHILCDEFLQSLNFRSQFVDLRSQQVRRTPYPGALPSYKGVACPVAERAARHEIINLPHFVLLGAQEDTTDIAAAFHKIDRWQTELRNLNQS